MVAAFRPNPNRDPKRDPVIGSRVDPVIHLSSRLASPNWDIPELQDIPFRGADHLIDRRILPPGYSRPDAAKSGAAPLTKTSP